MVFIGEELVKIRNIFIKIRIDAPKEEGGEKRRTRNKITYQIIFN